MVMMDIPAIDPKEISISIMEDRITIKGERKREAEVKEIDYYRSERVYGSFQRIIQLPSEVVGDKAKASYKDGVLKITIPKSQRAVPKEVQIETVKPLGVRRWVMGHSLLPHAHCQVLVNSLLTKNSI